MLPQLLDKAGPLPVVSPVDGQAIEPGHVYVAAPDRHLLLRDGKVLLRRGPNENRTRPAVNALFRSAAVHYGSRVVGVVLTGLLDDGTEGLIAIKAAGGTSLVQHPDDAEWPAMPRNALNRDHVDRALPLAEIGPLLVRLVRGRPVPACRFRTNISSRIASPHRNSPSWSPRSSRPASRATFPAPTAAACPMKSRSTPTRAPLSGRARLHAAGACRRAER